MKLSQVITKEEFFDLDQSSEQRLDYEQDFSEDEWDDFVNHVQDLAINMLQQDNPKALRIDDIAFKISAHEY